MAISEAEVIEHRTEEAAQQLPAVVTPSWDNIKEQSAMLEAAGKGTAILPKGITNRYQVAAILLKGAELGFAPMYALEMIALVDGKPVVQGQALAALILRAEGPHAIKWLESTDDRCTVGLKRRADREYERLTWTIEDAKRANLTGKNNWKNYPRTMLRWRALAEAARMYMPDVISGVYTPDEMNVSIEVQDDGSEAIDLTATPIESIAVASDPIPEPTEPAAQPRQKATKAQINTLEGVCGELAELRGKGEKWGNVLRGLANNLGIQAKGTADLSHADAQSLIVSGNSQIAMLRNSQEQPTGEPELPLDAETPEDTEGRYEF